jgi:hypothetical protein
MNQKVVRLRLKRQPNETAMARTRLAAAPIQGSGSFSVQLDQET